MPSIKEVDQDEKYLPSEKILALHLDDYLKLHRENYSVIGEEVLGSDRRPIIQVWGETIPQVWELAVLTTFKYGLPMPTEYDLKGEPRSKDARVEMIVTNPLQEPRLHRGMISGVDEFAVYTREVLDGARAHLVGKGRAYDYFDRLSRYPGGDGLKEVKSVLGEEINFPTKDQIEGIVETLASKWHSRRAQAVTWFPPRDIGNPDPPCFTRICFRLIKLGDDIFSLEAETNWRSRDLFKAALFNLIAFTKLHERVSERIAEVTSWTVKLDKYVDTSSSGHIYGKHFREVAGFFKKVWLRRGSFEERTYRTDDPEIQRLFEEGLERLENELALRPRQPTLSPEFGVEEKIF